MLVVVQRSCADGPTQSVGCAPPSQTCSVLPTLQRRAGEVCRGRQGMWCHPYSSCDIAPLGPSPASRYGGRELGRPVLKRSCRLLSVGRFSRPAARSSKKSTPPQLQPGSGAAVAVAGESSGVDREDNHAAHSRSSWLANKGRASQRRPSSPWSHSQPRKFKLPPAPRLRRVQ